MQVTRVVPREQFAPLAVEITEDVDVDLIDEFVKNTYGPDAAAWRRGDDAIGRGFIDVATYRGDWDSAAHIRPDATGWLLLDENQVTFYEAGSLWTEYKEYS